MKGLIVDLFAGGGGASTGLAWALGRDPDIAVNHDAQALTLHAANHPHTRHLHNDITRILPLEATGGLPVGILHATPDCTHFSKAKGGKPRSQYIRDLAWVVVRWAEDTRPMLITLENVEEFLTWGPLDQQGNPIKERAGDTFRAWVKRLRRLGYRVDWRLLRACDYGAPTTRRRLFVVARRDRKPIVWPRPTHGDPRRAEVRAGKLLPWRTAAECIDWTIDSRSIFDRKKPLAENTRRRIAEGMRRYVLQAAEPFIVTYYGTKKPEDFRGQALVRPLPTQTTENRFGLVSPVLAPFIQHSSAVGGVMPGNDPLRTITAQPKGGGMAVVAPILSRQFGQSIGQRVDVPHTTITQCNHDALVEAVCIAQHYGGVVGHEINKPLGTVTSIDHHSLVAACLVKYYGKSACSGADEPVHTLTGKEHMALTSACLVKYYGTAVGADVEDPMPTITAKARMGLVRVETGGNIGRYEQARDFLRFWGVIGPEDEAEIVHRGVAYRINDILMRMLTPRELYMAQGFPADYIIDRMPDGQCLTKTAQIRMCGNSVPPALVASLVKANGPQTWKVPGKPYFPLLAVVNERKKEMGVAV